MELEKIKAELEFIDNNFEFSSNCSMEMRNHILGTGLACYYDGTLMLSNSGELGIGYTKEELGIEDDGEEDITEAFFYNDEEERHDY